MIVRGVQHVSTGCMVCVGTAVRAHDTATRVTANAIRAQGRSCSTSAPRKEADFARNTRISEKWELFEYFEAAGFDVDQVARGMEQAYRAVAYVNSVENDDLGVERWTRLPVDAVALEQLASYDDKTNDDNGARLVMQVADPDDQVVQVLLCELTPQESGDVLARVMFRVASNPRALYGDDVEVAKNIGRVIFPNTTDEELSSLSARFLESMYSTCMSLPSS